ncbi:zinc ribbon domain-containing protein [Halalkalibacter krulwichiae]|uniref:Membrane-associated protein TcaA n=1 Tax=Halalkalibacter krulwichiae TaxID=199441 RepID=A0A1X9MGL3_9BACI|nr:zinc-ribbon domain-containing protein [Halalkalibacter krulwichiae]ARK32566.1 Membrane-associated protein TcaA [Halalkalibacter krulwichiae]
MKFCTNCGSKVEDQTPFCSECGAKVETVESPAKRQKQDLPTLASVSKKTKWLIASVVILLALGVGLYKFGESITDPNKQLQQFIAAIDDKDADTVFSLLQTADDSLPVTMKHIDDLLAYLEEDTKAKEELIEQLKQDVRTGGNFTTEENGEIIQSHRLITYEQRGKLYFLYDNFDFVLHPIALTVYTNEAGLTFLINGKEVSYTEIGDGYIDLGYRLPGRYDVTAVLSTDFLELDKELDVSHFNEEVVDFTIEVDYIMLDTTIDEATIYLNGTNTGETVEKGREQFGPVLTDGSMTLSLEKETPFGKVQSPDYQLVDDEVIVSFQLSNEQQTELIQVLSDHFTNWSKALIYRDSSYLKNYSDPLNTEFTTSIQNMRNTNSYYIAYIDQADFDLDSLIVTEENGRWVAYMTVQEKWQEGAAQSGSSNLQQLQYAYQYGFEYKDQKWKLFTRHNVSGLEGNRLETKTFDVQKQAEAVQNAEVFDVIKTVEVTDADFANFYANFIRLCTDAYNAGDYSMIAHLIDPESTQYQKDTANYIDYLQSRGIQEELLGNRVENVRKIGDNLYEMTTSEEFHIYYGDEGTAKYKAFVSVYQVRVTENGMKMKTMLETNTIVDEDLY